MSEKVLALTADGQMTWCSAPPEKRGRGNCPHVAHQHPGESAEDFLDRAARETEVPDEVQEMLDDQDLAAKDFRREEDEEEIRGMISELDQIAGEKVTMENLHEVLNRLTPQQMARVAQIGFEAAPTFSLPITEEHYDDAVAENQIYFSNLPEYGIGGKQKAIEQMFCQVGEMPTTDGVQEIRGNYREGLTSKEYFQKQFTARKANVAKSVSVSKPGYTQRLLFYCMSDVEVAKDCGGPYIDSLHCKIEGSVCAKCAAADGRDFKPGDLVGSVVSTNLAEPLVQVAMSQKHTGGATLGATSASFADIDGTFNAHACNPTIQKVIAAETTEEARQILFEELKEKYRNANVKVDDFNLKMIAKKLTSYKRDSQGLRLVRPGEKCDVVSLGAVGNLGNLFKRSELSSAYGFVTKPVEQEMKNDAANWLVL